MHTIVILVSGGIVQGVLANDETDVTLVDLDNISAGEKCPPLPDGVTFVDGELTNNKTFQWVF